MQRDRFELRYRAPKRDARALIAGGLVLAVTASVACWPTADVLLHGSSFVALVFTVLCGAFGLLGLGVAFSGIAKHFEVKRFVVDDGVLTIHEGWPRPRARQIDLASITQVIVKARQHVWFDANGGTSIVRSEFEHELGVVAAGAYERLLVASLVEARAMERALETEMQLGDDPRQNEVSSSTSRV